MSPVKGEGIKRKCPLLSRGRIKEKRWKMTEKNNFSILSALAGFYLVQATGPRAQSCQARRESYNNYS